VTAPESERRRPAWDEVQERQRRDRARVDAEHQAAVDAAPARPADTWRVCGEQLDAAVPGGGCTCSAAGPFHQHVTAALARLAGTTLVALAVLCAAWALAEEADRQRRHR
jgi:hypothetical protein